MSKPNQTKPNQTKPNQTKIEYELAELFRQAGIQVPIVELFFSQNKLNEVDS